jgi:hypothetical protein
MTRQELDEARKFSTTTLQRDKYNGGSYHLVGVVRTIMYDSVAPGDMRVKEYHVNVKPF